ncbi:hypothetical protein HPB50_013828 [Hyalomma asiaticum]|uniref:Uncharacterized protein n=1 Tax=Hyalomma asiaticum TaxID=266040 RepID=A0ACB7SW70_HYAAI|nr:hypothetical protein HPB50_013828 [Hyalomma asiaticum]
MQYRRSSQTRRVISLKKLPQKRSSRTSRGEVLGKIKVNDENEPPSMEHDSSLDVTTNGERVPGASCTVEKLEHMKAPGLFGRQRRPPPPTDLKNYSSAAAADMICCYAPQLVEIWRDDRRRCLLARRRLRQQQCTLV